LSRHLHYLETVRHEIQGMDCVSVSDDLSGKVTLQHKSNGKLYTLDPTVGTDDGTVITTEIYTTKFDFETMNLKSMQSLNIISDLLDSGYTIQVRWSDDDYLTWSSGRSIDLTDGFPATQQLGSFRRRAFRIRHADNKPLRLEALEVTYDTGIS